MSKKKRESEMLSTTLQERMPTRIDEHFSTLEALGMETDLLESFKQRVIEIIQEHPGDPTIQGIVSAELEKTSVQIESITNRFRERKRGVLIQIAHGESYV